MNGDIQAAIQQAISDLRAEMQDEMHARIESIREEMQKSRTEDERAHQELLLNLDRRFNHVDEKYHNATDEIAAKVAASAL